MSMILSCFVHKPHLPYIIIIPHAANGNVHYYTHVGLLAGFLQVMWVSDSVTVTFQLYIKMAKRSKVN